MPQAASTEIFTTWLRISCGGLLRRLYKDKYRKEEVTLSQTEIAGRNKESHQRPAVILCIVIADDATRTPLVMPDANECPPEAAQPERHGASAEVVVHHGPSHPAATVTAQAVRERNKQATCKQVFCSITSGQHDEERPIIHRQTAQPETTGRCSATSFTLMQEPQDLDDLTWLGVPARHRAPSANGFGPSPTPETLVLSISRHVRG